MVLDHTTTEPQPDSITVPMETTHMTQDHATTPKGFNWTASLHQRI